MAFIWIPLAFLIYGFLLIFGSYSEDFTIEIPREDGCIEVVTENNKAFGPDTIERSLVCTKEIG